MKKITVLAGMVSHALMANSYPITSTTNVKIGQAWDPLFPEANYVSRNCFKSETFADNKPISIDKIKADFVETEKELKELTQNKIDLSVEVQGTFGKGTLTGLIDKTLKSDAKERTLRWVIYAERAFQPIQISSVELSKTGIAVLEKYKDSSDVGLDFTRHCGRSVVSAISRGSRMGLVYSFNFTSVEKTNSARKVFTAAFNNAAVNASLKMDFLKEITSIDKEVRVSIDAFQIGVSDGVASLREVIGADPSDLVSIRKIVSEAVKASTYESSPITSVYAEPVSAIIPELSSLDDRSDIVETLAKRLDALRKQVEQYTLLHGVMMALNHEVILNPDHYDILNFSDLKATTDYVSSQKNKVLAKIKKCQFKPSLEHCEEGEDLVADKKLIEKHVGDSYSDLVKWNARSGGWYDNNVEQVKWNVAFSPVFKFKNVDFIDSVEFFEGQVSQGFIPLSQIQAGQHLDLSALPWVRNLGGSAYCWRGHWGEVCNPWAADKVGIANSMADQAGAHTYSLKIKDIFGRMAEVFILNPKEAKSSGYLQIL